MSRTDYAVQSGILSDRQLECLRGVAEGRSSKHIARDLGIAPSTVDNHIAMAVRLLGCSSRAEAARRISGDRRPEPHDLDRRWLPPLGGRRNVQPTAERLRQIITVSLLGIAVSAGGIATIAGVVHLLGK